MTEVCHASNANDLTSAIIAACAMLLTFAAVAVPVPLYAEYKMALGLTDADISLTMVSYLTGVLTTLFIGGSLSDALGRRPLVAAALLFGSLACALYIWLPNGAALQIARMVQGVSCGLTMSATSAFMLDCTSQRYRTFGTTIASTGCLIGMMIGSLGIGIYATFSRNYIPMFGVLIVLMMLNAVLLPLAQETVTHRITIRKAIKPLVHIRGMLYRGMGHRRVLPIAVNPCRRDVFPIHRPADPRAHVCAGHGPERAGRAHVRPHHHAIRRIRRHGAAVHQLRDLVGYAHEGHDGAVPDRRRRVQRFHRHPPVRQHAYAHQLQRPR